MSDVVRYALAETADVDDKSMIDSLVRIGVLIESIETGEHITNRDLDDLHIGDGPFTLFKLNNEQKRAVDEDGGRIEDYSTWKEPDAGEEGGYVVSIPPGQYFFIPVDR